MHQAFNATAAQRYWDIQQHEARILMEHLLTSPQFMLKHLRRNAAAVIMKIAYGYTIEGDDDHFVALAEESMRVGSLAGAPGKWLVDSFPILRFLPDWFPGAGFKRQAKAWSHQLYTQSLEPHNYVKQNMASGTAVPSFTSRLLNPEEVDTSDPEHEDIVLWTAGALYAGGADTSVSAMYSFFFCMMLHPEIQKRAQAEVDSVVAQERRLPTFNDRHSMPYLDCILKEVLRWATVTPIGIFHCTSVDDEYSGYRIPAKTSVISNIWAMLHDENEYPEPFRFNPDRFSETDGTPQRDPRDLAFGFGRRVCPGQYVAESSLFIQMATTLAVMNISKAVDETGKVMEPELAFTTAIVSYIKPFSCQITPRSQEAASLIKQSLAAGGK